MLLVSIFPASIPQSPRFLPHIFHSPIFQIFMVGLVGPLVESVILTTPIRIFRHFGVVRFWSAVLGSLPLTFLHFSVGWMKVAIVLWPFLVHGYCYLVLKEDLSPKYAFWIIFIFHAVNNSVAITISYLL